ncbi:hypothetical protein Y886_14555 [Xanthomonas hyacinthi DSM 19077]|nr:hypothetical protein Y886_14555 [Xanthomonas hyacinthi DSM 19077]
MKQRMQIGIVGYGTAGQALAQRYAHVAVYPFWSRWLTPLFQSERDLVARVRDLGMLPAGRMPGGRGHMLRVLSGTRHGWFGKLPLEPGFLQALAEAAAAPRLATQQVQGE